MDEKDQDSAVVIGGALAGFLAGVEPLARESVKLALMFAQRATREVFEKGFVDDWFEYYFKQLKFLGWDALPPGRKISEPSRGVVLERVLKTLEQAKSQQFADLIERAVRGMRSNPDALSLFDTEARNKGSVIFQFIPCAMQDPGYVDLVLYQREVVVAESASSLLYAEKFESKALLTPHVELVRFNARGFQQTHQAKVMAKLGPTLVRSAIAVDVS